MKHCPPVSSPAIVKKKKLAENHTEYDNIINVLGDLIADNSQDNYNFNLNGPGPKAPEGEF